MFGDRRAMIRDRKPSAFVATGTAIRQVLVVEVAVAGAVRWQSYAVCVVTCRHLPSKPAVDAHLLTSVMLTNNGHPLMVVVSAFGAQPVCAS